LLLHKTCVEIQGKIVWFDIYSQRTFKDNLRSVTIAWLSCDGMDKKAVVKYQTTGNRWIAI